MASKPKFSGKVGVLTISDSVFYGRNNAEDKSGPKIEEILRSDERFSAVDIVRKLVPDEVEQIEKTFIEWSDANVDLILSTGGTGFSPRDVTPEATKRVIERETPGITTAMFVESLKVTPHAMLSRATSGIRKNSLIVNLPGSPKAVTENLQTILPALYHGLSLIKNVPQASEPKAHQHSKGEAEHQHQHHPETSTFIHTCGSSHTESTPHSNPHTTRKVSPWPMISVDDALRTVFEKIAPLPVITLPVTECLGRVVAEDIKAKDPLPPFRASIKDGYAVKAEDGPGEYEVIGTVTAGRLPDFEVKKGTIARITTGSPVPNGADAIVMVENTELYKEKREGKEIVKVLQKVKPGEDIRPIGSDIAAGELVVPKGQKIGPAEIGVLSTVGVTKIPVHDWPAVAVLSTGDEVQDPSETLKEGCIRDANRSMLLAVIQKEFPQLQRVDLEIARDTEESLRSKINEGFSKADILITTGGVSMGELDLMQPIIQSMGTIHFGRVLMKPGKPLTFATVNVHGKQKLFFGLPGNPVSGIVTSYLLVVPTLRKLAGYANPNLKRVTAKLAHEIACDPERPEYHRCMLQWENDTYVATSTGRQISSRLMSMRTANGLALIPQQSGKLPQGTVVTVLIINE